MEAPFTITLYDKAFVRRGWIGDPQAISVTPRHNQQPTGQVTVRADHPAIATLVTPGCRAVIDYRGQQITSGLIDSMDSQSGDVRYVTAQVRDDFSLLATMLAWQVPTSAITNQTASAYDSKSGPAETVVKWYAGRAATRLGLPLTMATNLGRGSGISLQARMNPTSDLLLALADQAGIGITIRQQGAGLVLDCYEPAWFPLMLTPESGIVTDWAWQLAAPTFTRFVAGGQGELTARTYREYADTAAEALWGIKREGYVDATDVVLAADLVTRAQQNVAAAAATAGLKLSLAETDSFRYGDTLRVGDLVTTQLVPGADPITDVLREATLTWNADDGLVVSPTVGDRQDDTSALLAKAVSSSARRFLNYVAGR